MRHFISSSDNPGYRELLALFQSSRRRKQSGLSVIEGLYAVRTYLKQTELSPVSLWMSARTAQLIDTKQATTSLESLLLEYPKTWQVLSDCLFERVSELPQDGELLAVIPTPKPPLPSSIDTDAVLVENLQDPGNLGNLLRSTVAAGIKAIFLIGNTAYAWSPKVLRAAQGAHFYLKIYEGLTIDEFKQRLSIPLLATTPDGNTSLFETPLKMPLVWAFGNEGRGLPGEILQLAVQRVQIPMSLNGVESLNVASCAAICLFEMVRQRQSP